MPDTFASKTAALQDDSADAAIGNITGKSCHLLAICVLCRFMQRKLKIKISYYDSIILVNRNLSLDLYPTCNLTI